MKSPHQQYRRKGAAAVECAIVLWLMFVPMVMVLVGVTRFVMVGQILTDAARSACRAGTLPGASNTSLDNIMSNVLKKNNVQSSFSSTILVDDVPADVSTADTGGKSYKITVQISVPVANITWVPASYFPVTHVTKVVTMEKRR